MTRYFLTSLSIEGFRGINNAADPLVLNFRPTAVNSVYGPNGTGKSSVYEAVHFAICGNVPRLEPLQEAEDAGSYIVNRFHPSATATIVLEFTADDGSGVVSISVIRDSTRERLVTSPSGHPDPEGFLLALREDFVLLDYRKFADFIDSSALERGRSFASLVGLSRYSSLRQCLEGAKDTQSFNTDFGLPALESALSSEQATQATARQQMLTAYSEATGAEHSAVFDLRALVGAVTEALRGIPTLQPFLVDTPVTKMDFEAAERAVEAEEGGEARAKLARLSTSTTQLKSIGVSDEDKTAMARLTEIAQRRDEAVAKVGSSELLNLFRDALAIIEESTWPDPQLCPVCDLQSPSSIANKLQAQIALYEEAEALNVELGQAIRESTAIGKLGQLEDAPELEIPLHERTAATIVGKSAEQSIPTTEIGQMAARLEALETRRMKTVAAVEKQIAEIEAALPRSLVSVTRILSSAKQFCEAGRRYIGLIASIADKQERLDAIRKWKAFITTASDTFAAAETRLGNERIASIQTDYQRLFSQIVRGGQDVRPTLERASSREQVELKLEDFYGLAGLSARALLSESYRNAVAAAIFLSAAIRHSGTPRFMILDDVTSSFDAGHQVALMESLRSDLRHTAHASGLQFIVLSHDTILEKYFDRLNSTADWHHQRLQGMSPTGRVMVAAQEAERLRAQAQLYLGAGQIEIGAPFVRQYLEYKLGLVISRLAIPMPPDYSTRGDKRTLSTYLDGIVSAVELYRQAGTCVLTQQQIQDLTGRHAPAIIANFVSHYETGGGSPFSAGPLLGVLQSVDDLSACFQFAGPGLNPPMRFYRALDRRT